MYRDNQGLVVLTVQCAGMADSARRVAQCAAVALTPIGHALGAFCVGSVALSAGGVMAGVPGAALATTIHDYQFLLAGVVVLQVAVALVRVVLATDRGVQDSPPGAART